ncbi:MAG: DUF192 domain-containing protein [Rhodothermales bacterium]
MRLRDGHVAARFLNILFAAALVTSGCGGKADEASDVNREIPFTPEGVLDIWRADSSLVTRLVIELAESDQEQAQGLMYRRSLPERGGMLFVSPEPSMRSFWMRNTPLPLDIIFLDDSLRVVNIVKRTTPYSEEHILSTAPAQYVLEVRAGMSDRWGVDSTAYVTWERRDFSTANP